MQGLGKGIFDGVTGIVRKPVEVCSPSHSPQTSSLLSLSTLLFSNLTTPPPPSPPPFFFLHVPPPFIICVPSKCRSEMLTHRNKNKILFFCNNSFTTHKNTI